MYRGKGPEFSPADDFIANGEWGRLNFNSVYLILRGKIALPFFARVFYLDWYIIRMPAVEWVGRPPSSKECQQQN